MNSLNFALLRFGPFILPSILLVVRAQTSYPEVTLPDGSSLRGLEEASFDSRTRVQSFLGIRYAKSPEGELRFRPPEPVTRPRRLHDATQLADSCFYTLDTVFKGFPGAEMWNPKTRQVEDCLNLHLWVPKDNPQFDGTVLVWIYGGGFFSGSPSLDLYNGKVLAAATGVIVVNINYRLGPFGFLYMGNNEAPGNMGLLDQQLALKWVYENIKAFNGDPNKITLFGESAGSASVSSHLFAPRSHKYFRNVVMMSGSIMNSWALADRQQMFTRSTIMATHLGCHTGNTFAAVACMRNKTKEQIQIAADKVLFENVRMMEFPFVPMNQDGEFFTLDVRGMMRLGSYKKVPMLIGTVEDEGTYWLPYYNPMFPFNHSIHRNDVKNQALINWQQYLMSVNMTFGGYMADTSRKAVAMQYLMQSDSSPSKPQLRNAIGRMLGDYFFTCDLLKFAKKMSSCDRQADNQVYVYYFTQRSTVNDWPDWMGVMHGYEIEYIFGVPLRERSRYTRAEQEFSQKVMQLVSTFARTGTPSSYHNWPPYKSPNYTHVELNAGASNGAHVYNLSQHRCELLHDAKELFPNLARCDTRPIQSFLTCAASAKMTLQSTSTTLLSLIFGLILFVKLIKM